MLQRMKETERPLGGSLAQSPSHLHTYLKILQHCLLTVAAFLSKTWQMTHSDCRLIVFSFNESDERSADQVYSEVSQVTEQHQLHHRPAVICHNCSCDL